MRADQASCRLAISKKDRGGHNLNVHLYGCLHIFIGIHARKAQFACIDRTELCKDRRQRATGRAPGGCEIDDYRNLRLRNLLGKILVCNGQNQVTALSQGFSPLSKARSGKRTVFPLADHKHIGYNERKRTHSRNNVQVTLFPGPQCIWL
jgi:hypothetical protein